MNGQDNSNVHAALQYLISKAIMQGKLGKSTMYIPLTDFMQSFEGLQFEPEASDLILKINMSTEWANEDDILSEEFIGDLPDEGVTDDEEDDGNTNFN